MKYLSILCSAFLLLTACKKQSSGPATNPVNPSNPSTTKTGYHDLKYWVNDTLVGYDPVTLQYDTMYALNISGKNYIKYKGVQYAFKAYVTDGDTFSDSTGNYFYDLFDMSGNFITSKDSVDLTCQVYTSRSYSKSYNTWNSKKQLFYPPSKPPFPKNIFTFIGTKVR